MRREIRQIYEDEAVLRQDVFSEIYDGGASSRSAKIPFWAAYFLKLKQIWIEEILAKYIQENIVILDAGCGAGYLSGKFLDKNCAIYGMDISFNYLKIALKRNNAYNFIQADIQDLPFKDKSLDVLVCSEVLEHALEPERALKEIKRVTKKLFVSTVPVLPKILDDFRLKTQKDKAFVPGKGHFRNFQVKPYLAMLGEQGFKILTVQGIGFLWWLFSWFSKGSIPGYIYKIDSFFSNIKILRPLILNFGVIAELSSDKNLYKG